ncbi:hypothetical protein PoB_006071200 [Plakobranchus ocellatus]|uniref:Uncharacterized protein n=1 Tax=Plakobranchus ocellatus TaxID=259542 RepID=A0AAV4CQQ4_9GAST|nr:hypothetical protein PoB_006071200 [Plakobranchus ocellatus]
MIKFRSFTAISVKNIKWVHDLDPNPSLDRDSHIQQVASGRHLVSAGKINAEEILRVVTWNVPALHQKPVCPTQGKGTRIHIRRWNEIQVWKCRWHPEKELSLWLWRLRISSRSPEWNKHPKVIQDTGMSLTSHSIQVLLDKSHTMPT